MFLSFHFTYPVWPHLQSNWNHCGNVDSSYNSAFELRACYYHLFVLEDQSICIAWLWWVTWNTWLDFFTLSGWLKHVKYQRQEQKENKEWSSNIQVRHTALAKQSEAQAPNSSRFLKILAALLIIADGQF